MRFYPDLEQMKEIARHGEYKNIPLACVISDVGLETVAIFSLLKKVSKNVFVLESAEDAVQWGRYTFLGYDPKLEYTCINGKVTIKSGTEIVFDNVKPHQYIRKIIEENKSPRIEGLPPFTGGLVGYFSYDYIQYNEPSLALDASDAEGFNDIDLMLFDRLIVIDNLKNEVLCIANVRTDDLERSYAKAMMDIRQMVTLLESDSPTPEPKGKLRGELTPLFDAKQFCSMVETAKKHIYEGDIFQVVLSNRWTASYEGSLISVYEALRRQNPSPYMFYFSSDDIEIAGASPETLVKLENGRLFTYPLAGTRPRGATPEKDVELEKELLQDAKELAEHNMLVDLGRNDIGKISEFGSVKVEKYMEIARFSHVMHIASTVSGQIRSDKDGLDAIDAILPAGTLSGAPKFRACQIINALEGNKRGIYGGAIGYLAFDGNVDVCIAIRLAFTKNGKVFVRAGAGIVADSVPETEFAECVNKAKAITNALKDA